MTVDGSVVANGQQSGENNQQASIKNNVAANLSPNTNLTNLNHHLSLGSAQQSQPLNQNAEKSNQEQQSVGNQ